MDAENSEDRRLKIDEPYYNNLLEILNSNDIENQKIAFQIIENMDYEDNFVYILFLYRSCDMKKRMLWNDYAPNSCAFCEDLKKKYSLNVPGLHKSMKGKISEDQKDFVQRQFSESLKKVLVNYGHDFIKSLKIEIEW
jgi:hypothetical protein